MPAIAGRHQQQAHQRRTYQVEGPALGLGKCIAIARGRFAPVQRNLAHDRLQRHTAGRADEGTAQRPVAVQGGLPGIAQAGRVEGFDVHAHLVDVAAIARLIQAVEQHAVLHGRQRIEVFDLADRHRQAVQLRLRDGRQREVRRRGAANAGRQAMGNQRLQLGLIKRDQFLQPLRIELLRAERPAQLQSAVVHPTVDGQPIGQRRGRVQAGTAGLLRAAQQAALEAGIELAKVVEGDARHRARRQLRTHLGRCQLLQQAEAQAVVRHLAQVFLGGLERLTQAFARPQAQRISGGEPAHGTAQVEVGQVLFAAVAFQFQQQLGLVAPAPPGPGQGTQQQVIDLGAVGRRGIAQQLAGLQRVQLQPQGDGFSDRRRAVVARAREAARHLAQLRQPPGQLRQYLAVPGVLHEKARPLAEGMAARCQRRIAVGQAALQVIEQNPPGHAIDNQVMDRQQQAPSATLDVDQYRPQQRAMGQIQAALRLLDNRCQCVGIRRLAGP
ncbi:hypothetical protein D3C77_116190 [compost metagenome]